MLEVLSKCNNIEEINQTIKNGISKLCEGQYIPAIINEGTFTEEGGKDFYCKLVFIHQDESIDNTDSKGWIVGNLAFGLDSPKNKKYAYNVITYRNYKGNKLYQLNPIVCYDEYIIEDDINNNKFVNQYWEDYNSDISEKPILKMGNDEVEIFVLNEVLKENIKNEYRILCEYEYRTRESRKFDEIKHNDDYYAKFQNDRLGFRLLGGLILDIEVQEEEIETYGIKAFTLDGEVRNLNPKNYNDDIDVGLIVFNKEAINIIKEQFYYYHLSLIDKTKENRNILMDMVGENIVFFEGEYNHLPSTIKEKISKYNIKEYYKELSFFTKPMFEKELNTNWNYEDFYLPSTKLSKYIAETKFEIAIEHDLSFFVPQTAKDFSKFIIIVEQITKITLESLPQDNPKVIRLILIRDYPDKSEDFEEKDELFEIYCYAINERISNGNI